MTPRLVALLAIAALVAGCAQPVLQTPPPPPPPEPTSFLAGPALWEDPQDAPHPAYGWATLSNPGTGPGLPRWWRPIPNATAPAAVQAIEHVTSTEGLEQGAGLALFGSVAVVPDFAGSVHFVDIGDPTAPMPLSSIESSGRGAAIIAYPDGRLVAVVSTGAGFDVIEFTDPESPEMLAQVEPTQRGHKLGVVPGTPFVYNAASNGGGTSCQASIDMCTGVTEIYDLTDPADPQLVQDFANGLSCHHIFFWNSAERQRAICAGLDYTQIWDTADPAAPTVIVSIPAFYGRAGGPSGSVSIAAFSHSAGLSRDGTVLYVGDESGGGGLPPGCVASLDTPAGSVGTPVGAVWFYDVATETEPQVLGYYSALNDPRVKSPLRSCTAHHGRLVPDGDRDLLAMSFYGSGVVLVDFTAVRQPGGVPHAVDNFVEGSNTWETWYYNGYLFTGDLARGMDVFRLA
jgi:hypothetical protein